jgi:hypothetical protein
MDMVVKLANKLIQISATPISVGICGLLLQKSFNQYITTNAYIGANIPTSIDTMVPNNTCEEEFLKKGIITINNNTSKGSIAINMDAIKMNRSVI